MRDLGDRREDDVINFAITFYGQTGSPKNPAADPDIAFAMFKDGDDDDKTTEGITWQTHDSDNTDGLIRVTLTLTHAFYAPGSDYFLVLTAGEVDNVNLAGVCVATFSIVNRLMLPFPGIEGKVKTSSTPSTTVITCTGVPGGVTATHYANQALLWTSGDLKGLTFFITANGTQATDSLTLTLQTLPVAPSDTADSEDTFIILGTKGS